MVEFAHTPEVVDDDKTIQQINDEDRDLFKKYSVPKIPKTKYVREINGGQIHLWDERFGSRGDLVESYEPSLKERIELGEDLAELYVEGFSYHQLQNAGASTSDLTRYGVQQPKVKRNPPAKKTPDLKIDTDIKRERKD